MRMADCAALSLLTKYITPRFALDSGKFNNSDFPSPVSGLNILNDSKTLFLSKSDTSIISLSLALNCC